MNQQSASCAVVSALRDRINGLRSTIQYAENQILRCEIAIEETLKAKEFHDETALDSLPMQSPTVSQMVKATLPEMNGSVFKYSVIANKCVLKHPEHERKIRNGISQAFRLLVRQGVLEKHQYGFLRKPAVTLPNDNR